MLEYRFDTQLLIEGENLSEDEEKIAFNEIYNYMDFCNEQIFLRKNNRVRKKTWLNWLSGMQLNFALPIFEQTSKEVFNCLPTIFEELRKVWDADFNTDPKKW